MQRTLSLSPAYDSPEPQPRKFRPLPTRRRPFASLFDPSDIAAAQAFVASATKQGHEPTAPDALSPSQVPSYYMPLITGMQDLLKIDYTTPQSTEGILDVPQSTTEIMRGDEDGDLDYFDHLQQPGNTKKRKVPLAHHSPYSSELHATQSDALDGVRTMKDGQWSSDTLATREQGQRYHEVPFTTQRRLSTRKPPISLATRSGLHHKELLRTRKRQLVAVLGAMYNGDSLALDQALSSSKPFAKRGLYGSSTETVRVRLSRRRNRAVARLAAKARTNGMAKHRATIINLRDEEYQFSISLPSTTSKRLASTKEEVAILHSRFEAELAKQASRAADMAKRSTRTASSAKRGSNRQGISDVGSDQLPYLKPSKGSKKKKRSALANASNPHHLRNYVPSRVPHSGQAPPWASITNTNYQNTLGPLPLRFLSADLPPRHRNTRSRNTKGSGYPSYSSTQLTITGEEWICAFCEYDLFYGEDDASFRRAIRNRKRILSRRRRAREKAAATASGTKNSSTPVPSTSTSSHTDDGATPENEARGATADLLEHSSGREGEFVNARAKRERG